MRAVPAVGNLRRRKLYQAMRKATITAYRRAKIRIVHISIQRTHIHMIVEAGDKQALARGMQGFQISAARHINTALSVDGYRRRRGQVFEDRYHAEVITSPTQAHHALSYTLNNWRKHREDVNGPARGWMVDPFSSGVEFEGWQEWEARPWQEMDRGELLHVRAATTWLLREGWRRAGEISARAVPGKVRENA